jgi:hypothetical protein
MLKNGYPVKILNWGSMDIDIMIARVKHKGKEESGGTGEKGESSKNIRYSNIKTVFLCVGSSVFK